MHVLCGRVLCRLDFSCSVVSHCVFLSCFSRVLSSLVLSCLVILVCCLVLSCLVLTCLVIAESSVVVLASCDDLHSLSFAPPRVRVRLE